MSVSKRFTKDHRVTVTFNIKKEAAQGASKIAMKQQKNGTFKGSISVPEGEKAAYQYRFKYTFADNSVKYDNDWDAERYIANPFGGENSVFSAVRE